MSARTAAARATPLPALVEDTPNTWESEATNESCTRPLPGRESEYETVVAFVEARLHTVVHHNSLFVFGACGCGKTSTVLRAMRSFTRHCLPSDRQQKPARTSKAAAAASAPKSRATTRAAGKRGRASTDAVKAAATASASTTHATTLSQAVKKAKLEVSPRESTGEGAAAGHASLGASPASSVSAGHLSSENSTPQSARTHGRSSTDTVMSDTDAGRALFVRPSTSSLTADDEEEDNAPLAVMPFSPAYFETRYARLYDQRTAPSTLTKGDGGPLQFVQAHYVNCADLDAHQLAEALHKSIRSAVVRPDAATRALLEAVLALPQTARRHGGPSLNDSTCDASAALSATTRAVLATRKPMLHVVALDEVEYVRGPAARDVLSQLSTLSLHHPTQLALIFISNHRDLVHVPRALLDELPFEPYSIAQLKGIGSAVVQSEVQAATKRALDEAAAEAATARLQKAKGTRTAASSPAISTGAMVQISPTLLEYIARKALLDYSGDVRQVMAMCRRVAFTALEQSRAAEKENVTPPPKTRGTAAAAASRAGGRGQAKHTTAAPSPAPLEATLKTVVASFVGTQRTPSAAASSSACSSTRSSGAHARATDAATTSAPANAPSPPSRPTHLMTLANTASLLHGSAVETQVQKHISTMPEQQLYVLCCMLVLTLRHHRDASRAAMTIGGAPSTRTRSGTSSGGGSNGASASSSSSVAMREVHQLYTGLMGLRHFPSMNAAGITTAVDGLADLGIITRPQKRGNDQLFTFNGTWSLDAMQGALENRGEALRQELASCGLDATENKFTTVLRELKTLAGLQNFS